MTAHSDAEWYCRNDSEEEIYYDIFFGMCRKYNIRWSTASSKERAFIEEVTRLTYENGKASRLDLNVEAIRPAFAS